MSEKRIGDIKIFTDKEMPLSGALNQITPEWVGNGQYCDQTVLDLRNACVEMVGHLTALEAENAELRGRVAKYEQPPFPKCEECTYLKKSFPPHCMRGEEDTYCIHKQEATDETR